MSHSERVTVALGCVGEGEERRRIRKGENHQPWQGD